MFVLRKWIQMMAVMVLVIIHSPALLAGQSCKGRLSPLVYQQASRSALAINKKLNQSNPQVALLARVGTDLSKYGLYYSHIAFVVRDYPGMKNRWTVIHELNECNTDRSFIYKQGLMNFFMDDLYRFDAQLTLLDPKTQASLYQLLQANRFKTMHNGHYSMLAYPYALRYQNSNQWVLEVLAQAMDPRVHTRKAAQRYLQRTGFTPSLISVDPFAKLGAGFMKHVHFDDHPRQEQWSHRYATVSVDSVIQYLRRHGLVMAG